MPEGKTVFPYRGPVSTAGIESLRDGDFRSQRAAWRIEIGNEGWNWPVGDPYVTVADFIDGKNKAAPTRCHRKRTRRRPLRRFTARR